MYTSLKPYFYGTGRRKKSIARVRLYPGTGVVTISAETTELTVQLEELLREMRAFPGIIKAEVLAG